MLADGWFYSVNIETGAPAPGFMIGNDLPGGHPNLVLVTDPNTGLLMNDPSDDLPVYDLGENTHYHAYGPNGLLYLLDYDNNRMLMLDPNLSARTRWTDFASLMSLRSKPVLRSRT